MINDKNVNSWFYVVLAAAAMLMITMGARQSQGLFVFPISGSTGVSIVTISFAMAVGQFMWGAVAPVAGAVADRFGPAPVLVERSAYSRVGHGADTCVNDKFRPRVHDRDTHRDRRGCWKLFNADWNRDGKVAAGASWDRRGNHHCGRFVRSVCLRADRANVDFHVGVDDRDVVSERLLARRAAADPSD